MNSDLALVGNGSSDFQKNKTKTSTFSPSLLELISDLQIVKLTLGETAGPDPGKGSVQ